MSVWFAVVNHKAGNFAACSVSSFAEDAAKSGVCSRSLVAAQVSMLQVIFSKHSLMEEAALSY